MLYARFWKRLARLRRTRSPDQGFVLLLVLWFLLLAGTIGIAVMLSGLRAARGAHADVTLLRQELLLEGALNEVLYDLLVHGPRSQWATSGAAGSVTIDGTAVTAKVTNEAGRLDLNSASYEAIERVLEAIGIEEQDRIAFIAALDEMRNSSEPAERRLGSFSEVMALPGMTLDTMSCLYPLVTLYTGRSEPAAQWAPSKLPDILVIEPPREVTDAQQQYIMAGTVYRIELAAQSTWGELKRTAILRLTGKPQQPVWAYPGADSVPPDSCTLVKQGH